MGNVKNVNNFIDTCIYCKFFHNDLCVSKIKYVTNRLFLFLATFDVDEEFHSSGTWSGYRTLHRREVKGSTRKGLCVDQDM
jgi:hypothetical protein